MRKLKMQNHSLKQTWVSYGCGVTLNAQSASPALPIWGCLWSPHPKGQCLCPSLGWLNPCTFHGIHQFTSLPWNPCPFHGIHLPFTESQSLPWNSYPFQGIHIPSMFGAPRHKGKAPMQAANEDKYTICWQSRWLIARGKLNYARSNNGRQGQTPSFVLPIVRHLLEFESEHSWISTDCVFLHNSHIVLIIFRVIFIWNSGKVSISVSEAGHQTWETAAFSG